MIILVQSCLLKHGFISAVSVSLNDCQLVASAFLFSFFPPNTFPPKFPLFPHHSLPPPAYLIRHFQHLHYSFISLVFHLFLLKIVFSPLALFPSLSSLHPHSLCVSIPDYLESFCLAASPRTFRASSHFFLLLLLWFSWPCSSTSIIFHRLFCFLVHKLLQPSCRENFEKRIYVKHFHNNFFCLLSYY